MVHFSKIMKAKNFFIRLNDIKKFGDYLCTRGLHIFFLTQKQVLSYKKFRYLSDIITSVNTSGRILYF